MGDILNLAFRISNYKRTGPIGSADKRIHVDVTTTPQELNSEASFFCYASGQWGVGEMGTHPRYTIGEIHPI